MSHRTNQLFAKALKKHRNMVKRLEDNFKIYEQFLNLDEDKVNAYLGKLEKYSEEFSELTVRLGKFQAKIGRAHV